MTDLSQEHSPGPSTAGGAWWRRPDPALVGLLALPLLLTLLDPAQVGPMLGAALRSLAGTAPFLVVAVLMVAGLKATGAEVLLARAFEGRESRMILFAAVLGGLSPFCSCEVIPFVAAMLAVGAPLSAVMAFWLASPLMDPAMFVVTSATLGLPFAIAKAVAAVGLGLFGGFTVKLLKASPVFADPLKIAPQTGCGCGSAKSPFQGRPHWQFWTEAPRRETFRQVAVENALFLGKWLLLAYMVESLMITYIPASTIAGLVGGTGPLPVVIAALVGAPAYLNGYAAMPLIAGLQTQGMSAGAAMSFVIAGGVTCIPAMLAVWALVKPRVFAAYVGLAFVGAVAAGLIWGALA